MDIVFFGSFQHYSARILQALIDAPEINVVGVVTTPPMPVGRKQIVTKTPVHLLAEQHHIPTFTSDPRHAGLDPASILISNRSRVEARDDNKPDFFITAGYGKILPQSWLNYPTKGCLNLHFSLLPAYRGANPAEWAIMCGETKTGITLIEMSDKLDAGDIVAQAEIPIIGEACPEPSRRDTRETLYDKLYRLGAEKLPQWLLDYDAIFGENEDRRRTPLARLAGATAKRAGSEDLDLHQNCKRRQPPTSPTPYAALLKRDDGFLPWSTITQALQGQTLQASAFPSKHLQQAFLFSQGATEVKEFAPAAGPRRDGRESRTQNSDLEALQFLHRLPRALVGYPSLWTIVPTTKGDKRMKILSFSLNPKSCTLYPDLVQLEGKSPTPYNQIKNQIV